MEEEKKPRIDSSQLPDIICIQVKTNAWPGTAKLEAEDLGLDKENIPEIFKLGNKLLYPPEYRLKFTSVVQKAVNYLDKVGMPFVIRSVKMIPRLSFPKVWRKLEEIKKEFHQQVDDFLIEYPKVREDWLAEHEDLRSKLEDHYPPVEKLKERFRFDMVAFQIKGLRTQESDEVALIDTIEEAKQQFEAQCQDMVKECIEVLRQKVAAVVKNLSDRIREGKVVRNDTIQSVKNIHEQFKELNIFGDTDIDASLGKLRTLLDNRVSDAVFLKDNKSLQDELLVLADAVSKSAENLSDTTGLVGRYKRTVELD